MEDRAANKTHKPKTHSGHGKQNPSNPETHASAIATHLSHHPSTSFSTPTKTHHPDLNPSHVDDPQMQTHEPKPTKKLEHIKERRVGSMGSVRERRVSSIWVHLEEEEAVFVMVARSKGVVKWRWVWRRGLREGKSGLG